MAEFTRQTCFDREQRTRAPCESAWTCRHATSRERQVDSVEREMSPLPLFFYAMDLPNRPLSPLQQPLSLTDVCWAALAAATRWVCVPRVRWRRLHGRVVLSCVFFMALGVAASLPVQVLVYLVVQAFLLALGLCEGMAMQQVHERAAFARVWTVSLFPFTFLVAALGLYPITWCSVATHTSPLLATFVFGIVVGGVAQTTSLLVGSLASTTYKTALATGTASVVGAFLFPHPPLSSYVGFTISIPGAVSRVATSLAHCIIPHSQGWSAAVSSFVAPALEVGPLWRPTLLALAVMILSLRIAPVCFTHLFFDWRNRKDLAESEQKRVYTSECVQIHDVIYHSPEQTCRGLADQLIRTHPPTTLGWGWQETVAMEGILALAVCAQEPKYLGYVHKWTSSHAEEALDCALWAHACAPAIVALSIERSGHGNEATCAIIERVATYLHADTSSSAVRTHQGAISHFGEYATGLFPAMAWVDSLYMHGVFLNRLAVTRGEEWALEEAERMALQFSAHLQDPKTGYYRHAFVDGSFLPGTCFPAEDCFWARGNAWALFFLIDHWIACMSMPRPRTLHSDVAAILSRLLTAVLEDQDKDSGMWRTDLRGRDIYLPYNYCDTSACAFVCVALGRAFEAGLPWCEVTRTMNEAGEMDPLQSRWTDRSKNAGDELKRCVGEAAVRALRGLRCQIRFQNGTPHLEGTSMGTVPGHRCYYRSVPQQSDALHGIGGFLMAENWRGIFR